MSSLVVHVPIPWDTVVPVEDSILLSRRFVNLLIDADLPSRITAEDYELAITVEDDGTQWSQYRFDLSELDRPVNDYCPADQITRGLFNNEFNFVDWVMGNTAGTDAGFVYSGEAKLPFCIPYDYELPLPTLLGDEIVTLPFIIRVWRRDPFISLRQVRYYIQQGRRPEFVPSQYHSDVSPFTPADFERLCRPFGLGKGFSLAHLNTGFDVVIGSAASNYEAMVAQLSPHLAFAPLLMTVVEFDDIVRLNLELYTIDGEVFAEYWLSRIQKALEFKKNQILDAVSRSRGQDRRFYPLS